MSTQPNGKARANPYVRAATRPWSASAYRGMLTPMQVETSTLYYGHVMYALLLEGNLHQFEASYARYKEQLGLDDLHLRIVQQGSGFDVDWLLTQKRILHRKDMSGKTFLHYITAANGVLKPELVVLSKIYDKYGLTALMIAAHMGRHDCDLLYYNEQGLVDANGRSALMYAIMGRKIACINKLFATEYRIVDCKGKSVFFYLRKHGITMQDLTVENQRLVSANATAISKQ